MRITYGYEPDVLPGDVLQATTDGWLIIRGDNHHYLRFRNIQQYATWLDRNATHFQEPEAVRRMARLIVSPDLEVTR